jgi:hypothetical protein
LAGAILASRWGHLKLDVPHIATSLVQTLRDAESKQVKIATAQQQKHSPDGILRVYLTETAASMVSTKGFSWIAGSPAVQIEMPAPTRLPIVVQRCSDQTYPEGYLIAASHFDKFVQERYGNNSPADVRAELVMACPAGWQQPPRLCKLADNIAGYASFVSPPQELFLAQAL